MDHSSDAIFVSDAVRAVRRLHHDLLTAAWRQRTIREHLEQQAERILEAHQQRNPAAAVHLNSWHPERSGQTAEAIFAHPISLDEARTTIAREYGFGNWDDAVERGGQRPDADFESVLDRLLAGETAALQSALDQNPSLAVRRSCYGHRSTLLHYVAANGVETHRQVTPRNLAELTQVLIDAGADVNATADMYGGGMTPLALLISSSHPELAGVVDDVAGVLRAAGAETDLP